MPTDLPPDYKPQPLPGDGKAPDATPTPQGEDVKGQPASPQPGVKGLPGQPGDVVNPPGWKQPPTAPDSDPLGVPAPAGTPTF